MNSQNKTRLAIASLAVSVALLGITIPVIAHTPVPKSNYVREVVEIGHDFNRLFVIEDIKRNRVCYIVLNKVSGRESSASCVILDQNNPR